VTRKSARQYSTDDKRGYTGNTSKGLKPPVGMDITTDALYPEITLVDITGSMRWMPRLFLEKLATLYEESNAVLHGYGPDEMKTKAGQVPDDLASSIIAVGDAHCDRYPLQVANFERRAGLITPINNIYPEGGGNGMESYDLAAYYLLNHCETPKALIKPILIIAGDEGFYRKVNNSKVHSYIGDDLADEIDSRAMFKQLAEKFNTYILRPEVGSYGKDTYGLIHEQWESVLGKERTIRMDDPEEIVNKMIVLAGLSSDHLDSAWKMLKRREEDWELESALRGMHPLLKSLGEDPDKLLKSVDERISTATGAHAARKKPATTRTKK